MEEMSSDIDSRCNYNEDMLTHINSLLLEWFGFSGCDSNTSDDHSDDNILGA